MGIRPVICPIPRGIIVMWSGSVSSIPQGWLLCDGSNGTPDLRERFVLGASTDAGIGNTGGNTSIALTVPQLPAHSHTGTTNIAGNHTHDFTYLAAIALLNARAQGDFDVAIQAEITEDTAAAGDHFHTFTTNETGNGDPIDIRNPFYTLAFIMKT